MQQGVPGGGEGAGYIRPGTWERVESARGRLLPHEAVNAVSRSSHGGMVVGMP